MNNISQLVDTITRTQFDSVNKVTRKSCIDHVYCNYKHRLSSIRVVTCGASDHDAIVYTRYSKTPKLPARTIRKRSYKHFNREKYIEEISKTDFSGVYSSKDVDTAAQMLTNILVDVLNRHAPWIIFQERKNFVPWVTMDTKKLMEERDLYKKEAKTLALDEGPNISENQKDLWTKYKKKRNQVSNRLRSEEIRFKKEKVKSCGGCSEKIWKVAKSFMNWTTTGAPSQLEISEYGKTQFVTKARDIANIMNNYFVHKVRNIVKNLKDVPPNFQGCEKIVDGKQLALSLRYIPVKKVKKLLKSLKNKSSISLDQLDNFAVKLAADYIAEPLHHVITLSLMQNKFPECWKWTKIVPLHKKGCTLKKENYRPVAILSPLSKVLERAVFEQIYNYFDRNNLFHESLHGYRTNRSTTTALFSMYDRWVSAASNGQLSGVVLVDLSVAFDLVAPHLLIQKLRIYGMDEDFHVWISNYITNRFQSVWITMF